MPTLNLSYQLYDTAIFNIALAGEVSLFQVPQGGDATHTKSFTNARGAGFLPQNESFDIDNIGIYQDFMNLVPADLENVWISNYIFIRVSDQTLFFSPLRSCARYNEFNGFYSQAAAANATLGGLAGGGYNLDNPITIPGGVAFSVVVAQVTPMTVNAIPVRCVLDGVLHRQV
jgi:hypothetical protein